MVRTTLANFNTVPASDFVFVGFDAESACARSFMPVLEQNHSSGAGLAVPAASMIYNFLRSGVILTNHIGFVVTSTYESEQPCCSWVTVQRLSYRFVKL